MTTSMEQMTMEFKNKLANMEFKNEELQSQLHQKNNEINNLIKDKRTLQESQEVCFIYI